jgi:phosphoribosylaminoimidazole-succinocarboxamide synthase
LNPPLLHVDLPLDHHRRGKVRDVYDVRTTAGRDATLLVASDRLSAFDVVLPDGIPDKGRVLTRLSAFWFTQIQQRLGGKIPHHLLSTDADDIAGLDDDQRQILHGRVMLGRRCRVIPIECVARGYLAGSGWREYQQSQSVCGVPLPAGLKQSARLPEPIFTPATKADAGHDENIPFDRAAELVGRPLMQRLRDMTLTLYQMGHEFAAERGILLADTKFEFGLPLDQGEDAQPILIDEALTPDSSRFWPADDYEPGRDQQSYDKQFVRNHLQELCDRGVWDKQPPGPSLPPSVVEQTAAKYHQVVELLTGQPWDG